MTYDKNNAAAYAEVLRWLSEDGQVEVYNSGAWIKVSLVALDDVPVHYRRITKPTPRLMLPDELPMVFWLKTSDQSRMCLSRSDDGRFWFAGVGSNGFTIEQLHKQGRRWSTDGKTWREFTTTDEVWQ